jgi:serine/threonine protein kinase
MNPSYFALPQNIGFNNAGVLKLYNFSKAQSLARKSNTTFKPYDMVLCTKAVYHGTRPYTAPEIALKVPCNISVDTYAFAIVLWEIMSLKLCLGREMKNTNTFGALLEVAYDSKAQKGTQRPKIEEDTPKAL